MLAVAPAAGDAVFSEADEDLASSALSMRTPRTGGGELRFGGSGPCHGPILGGVFFSRTPAGDDGPRRLLDSTILEFLHTSTPLACSPEVAGNPASQNRLAGVGNPASAQYS